MANQELALVYAPVIMSADPLGAAALAPARCKRQGRDYVSSGRVWPAATVPPEWLPSLRVN